MTKGTRNASDKIVGRLCHTPRRFAFVLSAEGALFIVSLGQRPRIDEKTKISAEGAIHFPPPQLATHTDLIRPFSACLLGIRIPGAMPQANNDIAPLALGRRPSEREANKSNALQPSALHPSPFLVFAHEHSAN